MKKSNSSKEKCTYSIHLPSTKRPNMQTLKSLSERMSLRPYVYEHCPELQQNLNKNKNNENNNKEDDVFFIAFMSFFFTVNNKNKLVPILKMKTL